VAAFSTTDTIVAVATPPGRGGIGILRLSGPAAEPIARRLTRRRTAFQPRRATFARLSDPTAVDATDADGAGMARARVVDHVVVTWFAAPHSFTGEDVVEIGAHGSPVLLERIVELAMAAGARLAEPGEFTLRAHLNGRLDLVQAEAIADVVDAVTPLQARAAMDQLEGTLTEAIGRVDAVLFDLIARLEASLDFPEEGFHFVTRADTAAEIESVRAALAGLVAEGRAGRVVREGRLVVVTGAPNAGKSSLFNALVGASRAIVTDVPGTTRDLLSERVDVGGVPITLVDTAGLREARDVVEAEGVRRAIEAQSVAAVIVEVVDGSAALPSRLADGVDGPATRAVPDAARITVVSKVDRPRVWPNAALGASADAVVETSVVSGVGIDALRRRILSALTSRDEWRDTPAVTNLRHVAQLETALEAVERAARELGAGATEELVLAGLAEAREALEAITGVRAPEDLLRHIFSRFCIGK
jgi:tRNA modification GTPase